MKIFTSVLRTFSISILFSLLAFPVLHAQTKHTIEVRNYSFTPDELKINTGDTVVWTNLEGYHNVNGTQATFSNNPESFGNDQGNGWTYSYVFHTPGIYNYQCDPHAGLGMTGVVEVENSIDLMNHVLTLNFSSMNPHVGQNLYLSIVEKSSGQEIARNVEVIQADFMVQVLGIEQDHSYYINFFADFNSNGMYDAPPTDHAWQLELNNVAGDTTLNFIHNTSFTDIMWKYNLTVNFSSMNPHVGQILTFYVKESESGTEVYSTQDTVTPSFIIQAPVLETGKSYHIDFYADHNSNGMYDAPPSDHAWRLELNNVAGDTTLEFVHNINFTDIFDLTSASVINNSLSEIYPNPVHTALTIETDYELSGASVSVYNLAGKKLTAQMISRSGKQMTLDVSMLRPGIYILEFENGESLERHKMIKQ